MKNTLIILFFSCFLIVASMGQDPQFSQFYSAHLFLGPSFAGSTPGGRVALNFRDQWAALPHPFITYSFAFDHVVYGLNSGLGFIVLQDQAGAGNMKTTTINLQYSYHVKFKNWSLRPGLSFGFGQRSVDYNKLTFGDQLTMFGTLPASIESPTVNKVNYFDGGASLLAYANFFWAGFGVDHFTFPSHSMMGNTGEKIPLKYSIYGGSKICIKNKGKDDEQNLSFAFLFKSQKKYDQFDIGLFYFENPIVFGLWYRGIPHFKSYDTDYSNHDAVVLLVGYNIKQFRIGYSYDFTISRLFGSTGGSHEISLVLEFNQKYKPKKKHKIVSCPKFYGY